MKKLLFLIAFILFAGNTFSQENPQIKNIRTKFNNTVKNLKYYNLVEYSSYDYSYKAFFDSLDECVLLTRQNNNPQDIKQKISFYSKGGSLYFVFIESESVYFDYKREERAYLNDSAIIKILYKEKKFEDLSDFDKIKNQTVDPNAGFFDKITADYNKSLKELFEYNVFPDENDSLQTINEIRKEYNLLMSQKQNFTEHEIYYQAPMPMYWLSHKIKCYFDNKQQIRIMEVSWADEGYFGAEYYYFKNRKLFFAFFDTENQASETETFYQTRVYFADNKILAYLYKEIAGDKNELQKIPNSPKIFSENKKKQQYDSFFHEIINYKAQFHEVMQYKQ